MNFRLRRWNASVQEVEAAVFVGLGDVILMQRRETESVYSLRWLPAGAALDYFFFADQQIQFSIRNIQFDQLSILNKRLTSSDITFRSHVARRLRMKTRSGTHRKF